MSHFDGINLAPYLEDLERRIDDDAETALFAAWKVFASGDYGGDGVFSPRRDAARPPGIEWPRVLVDDALDSKEAMALQQLGACSALLAAGGGRLMAVRANYGTPIIPSILGAEVVRMDRELDTLPCSKPVSVDALRYLTDHGRVGVHAGLGRTVLEFGDWLRELLKPYPLISRHVHVYHPDTQGPMDICEMLRGSEIFEETYTDPEFIVELLRVATETSIDFLRAWQGIWPLPDDGFAVHWGLLHRGTVMLREDSAMNLSGAMFRRFMTPYDTRVLEEFGGGAIHFCGRGDHYIAVAAALPGIWAFNMSQPELNDMEKILASTIDRGLVLIDFPAAAAERAMREGRSLRGRVNVNV